MHLPDDVLQERLTTQIEKLYNRLKEQQTDIHILHKKMEKLHYDYSHTIDHIKTIADLYSRLKKENKTMASATETTATTGNSWLDVFMQILKEADKPLDHHIIVALAAPLTEHLIPLHIIGIKTYILRKLKSACSSGLIRSYKQQTGHIYYVLKEWENGRNGIHFSSHQFN